MSIYEEIEIEDMVFDEETEIYYYPCPCGDKFNISLEELYDGEDIATCPSCTLRIRVIFDEDSLPPLREDQDPPISSDTSNNELNTTQDPSTSTPPSSSVNSINNTSNADKNKEKEESSIEDLIVEKIREGKHEQSVFNSTNEIMVEELSSS